MCFPRLQLGFQYHTPHSTTFTIVQLWGQMLVQWLQGYSSGRSQHVLPGRKSSKIIPNDAGILQGAVLSPFLFCAHLHELRVPSPAALFKYADDLALCGPYCHADEITRLLNELSRIAAWSAEHGLRLNRSICMECLFTFSRQAPSHVNPPTFYSQLDTLVCHRILLHWSDAFQQLGLVCSYRPTVPQTFEAVPLHQKIALNRSSSICYWAFCGWLCHAHAAVLVACDFSRFIAERFRKSSSRPSSTLGCERPQNGVVLFPNRGAPC